MGGPWSADMSVIAMLDWESCFHVLCPVTHAAYACVCEAPDTMKMKKVAI